MHHMHQELMRLEGVMGRLEAAKRAVILQMSLVGLVVQTLMYIFVWQRVYNDIMQNGMWRSFHRRGFWLLAAVYFILLCFLLPHMADSK